VEIAGAEAALHDVAGTNVSSGEATRILGAIQHRDGTAWFFKMTGDDALVAKQRPAFLAFLKSVKYEPAETAELPAGHPPVGGTELPAGHPEISSTPTAAPVAAAAPSADRKLQ
jgi:hypothetical protein